MTAGAYLTKHTVVLFFFSSVGRPLKDTLASFHFSVSISFPQQVYSSILSLWISNSSSVWSKHIVGLPEHELCCNLWQLLADIISSDYTTTFVTKMSFRSIATFTVHAQCIWRGVNHRFHLNMTQCQLFWQRHNTIFADITKSAMTQFWFVPLQGACD